jgi:hypothetical protein
MRRFVAGTVVAFGALAVWGLIASLLQAWWNLSEDSMLAELVAAGVLFVPLYPRRERIRRRSRESTEWTRAHPVVSSAVVGAATVLFFFGWGVLVAEPWGWNALTSIAVGALMFTALLAGNRVEWVVRRHVATKRGITPDAYVPGPLARGTGLLLVIAGAEFLALVFVVDLVDAFG